MKIDVWKLFPCPTSLLHQSGYSQEKNFFELLPSLMNNWVSIKNTQKSMVSKLSSQNTFL